MKMKTIRTRSIHILVLAAVFFVSGLVFFITRMIADEPVSQVASVPGLTTTEPAQPIPALRGYPLPKTFTTFTYTKNVGDRVVSGTCADMYFVVLVFAQDVDYRVSPLDAKYNRAVACTGGKAEVSIPTDTLPLTEGERYYVIMADQGRTGTWYNPR